MDDATKTDQAIGDNANSPAPESPEGEAFQAAACQEVDTAAVPATGDSPPSLDVIMDVPVTLSLEVGRTKMSVGQLLRLRQGSVVELDRLAGEPLDVLVNGQLIAHGEIVVINDKFGIRLIDVVSPVDRLVPNS